MADPCLFIRKLEKEICYIALWVDDCFMMGDEALLEDSIKKLSQELKIKISGAEDYLSCMIKYNKDETKCWVGQPHLTRKIEKVFGDMVKKLPNYRTPGTPNLGIYHLIDPEAIVNPDDHAIYRKGVGMLLYLTKYSRSDIANAVRELVKGMQGPTPNAYKEVKKI